MHLAEFDFVHCLEPLDHPSMQGLVDNLDRIYALAESCPGFVWRLNDGEPDLSNYTLYDDPLVMINMSVWESVRDLRHFMFKTEHREIIGRGREWFRKTPEAKVAFWWIEPGTIPTVAEGQERLAHLQEHGESEYAFSYASRDLCELY